MHAEYRLVHHIPSLAFSNAQPGATQSFSKGKYYYKIEYMTSFKVNMKETDTEESIQNQQNIQKC